MMSSLVDEGLARAARGKGSIELLVVFGVIIGWGVDLGSQTAPFRRTVVRPMSAVSSRGTQATIICPAGAVQVSPGTNIQAMVQAHPGNTTFCLDSGVHNITYETTPKSGDTFVGKYGAVLDGSQWTTTNGDTAAFRALNQDIDDVTIRNLVIRNMPGSAIAAFYWMSDRWTIDHNELAYNKKAGVSVPNDSVVSNNTIHHNVGDPESPVANENGGGYLVYKSNGVLFLNNEIAYNGTEQKMSHTGNVVFRGNYVHHNMGQGIWYDGDNPGSLVEDNLLEDNGRLSILYEISREGIIRNNIVRRSGWQGIGLVTSKAMEIYGNTIEDSGRGIGLYLYCPAPIGVGKTGWDLADNFIHDNVIKVAAASGAFANSFLHAGCATAQVAPYVDGSKNNRFANNRYFVTAMTGTYWQWGDSTMLTWAEWQARGQDTTGSVQSVANFPASR